MYNTINKIEIVNYSNNLYDFGMRNVIIAVTYIYLRYPCDSELNEVSYAKPMYISNNYVDVKTFTCKHQVPPTPNG